MNENNRTGKPGSPMQINNSGTAAPRHGKLGKETQSRIGQQLRAMYDEVVQQGVPDRFADLLRRLDKRDGENEESEK